MQEVVYLQPALILQHRKYRESSMMIDVLTRDYGIVPMIAKGVYKKKSANAGLLTPFTLLKLSFTGKSELKTLTDVDCVKRYVLSNLALYCGFYINELIQLFLHRYDPHPEVFELYCNCLQRLTCADAVEQSLRLFELKLIGYAGYAVILTYDALERRPVRQEQKYQYVSGLGMQASENGYVAGNTLMLLANERPLDSLALHEAKVLLRHILDDHLQGKEIKSRAVLSDMFKYLR